MDTLPSISTVPSLTADERAAILDRLFEPCVPLHTLSVELLGDKNFQNYDELINSIGVQLTDLAESTSTSDSKWLDSILAAHPRLGDTAESVQSSIEQSHLHAESGDDGMSLSELNALYEKKFPGLRYVCASPSEKVATRKSLNHVIGSLSMAERETLSNKI